MPTYKTPDVYVEEISLLPRSVAEVESAIPAFIGYTEKASDGRDDLTLVPTPVDSLVEFESLFGGEPPVVIENNSLVLDSSSNLQSVRFVPTYYLHDAVRLFFDNGGGRCYIVSVGNYNSPVTDPDLRDGLDAVARQDEVTLIVMPDAVRLGAPALYQIQQAALAQCGKLKDRFAILDLLESLGWENGVTEFRNHIGVNHLSYGAAYTPHIKTTLTRLVTYRELRDHLPTIFPAAEPEIQDTVDLLDSILSDVDEVSQNGTRNLARDYNELRKAFRAAAEAETPVIATVQGAFRDLIDFIYESNFNQIDRWARNPDEDLTPAYQLGGVPTGDVDVPTFARGAITSVLRNVFFTLNRYIREVEVRTGATNLNDLFGQAGRQATHPDAWNDESDTSVFDPTNANLTPDNSIYPIAAPTDDSERLLNMRSAEPFISNLFQQYLDVVNSVLAHVDALEMEYETTLRDQYPLYANIARDVGTYPHAVPPSGAVAGVYAAVDESRGVWKAPANVSLVSVTGLTQILDNDDQEDLNVDPNFGKSINAIRPFTGRGILVWGARTLAGNDNEWRYVSVRRFFIMVEESLKKATLWAVFEPNDANLWVKVKSMIENYLTEKWRDGALAGAKAEDAFFVNVGLGETMTSQDILEGRLIVEVGMAVVRPAEFIVLRFSHKMQTS